MLFGGGFEWVMRVDKGDSGLVTTMVYDKSFHNDHINKFQLKIKFLTA